MTTELNLHHALDFALEAAWQAGRITLGYFQTGVVPEQKADDSPVTIADRQAEQKLRAMIAQAWPEHGIIGEEYGTQAGSTPYTWVLDPIDGTKSFMRGVPLYGVLVSLVQADTALVGVAHFPGLGETVYAGRGLGCRWDGRPAQVSSVSEMREAVLLASDLDKHVPAGHGEAFARLCAATYFQRTWGDAYGYALVATGRAEVMVDSVMKIWDCAAMQVIVEEAGGTFTDWHGKRTISGESIATNGVLFDAVMRLAAD